MAERIAKIVLLVEDSRQESLLRRYLHQLGHDNHAIYVRKSPKGRGSGEQFVREQYALEVYAIRSQLTRTKACLIVMIDADVVALDDRKRQFARALQNAEEPARNAQEPILNLITKRNVETWILCLNAEVVDEIGDYRNVARVDSQSIKQRPAPCSRGRGQTVPFLPVV